MSCRALQDQIHLKLCFITGDMKARNLGGCVAEVCRDHHQVMSGAEERKHQRWHQVKRLEMQKSFHAEILSNVP